MIKTRNNPHTCVYLHAAPLCVCVWVYVWNNNNYNMTNMRVNTPINPQTKYKYYIYIYVVYIFIYKIYIYRTHTQTCLYLIRISQTIVKHTFNTWTTTTKKKIPWGLKKICWGLINITVPRVSYKPHSISISIFSFNFPVNFCISTLP